MSDVTETMVQCEHCQVLIPICEFNDHEELCSMLHAFTRGLDPNTWMATLMLGANLASSEFNEYEMWSQLEEMVGKNEIGIEDVNRALVEVQTSDVDNGDVCPICLEDMSVLQGKIMSTGCAHVFCGACITKWLKSNVRCPVCMLDLRDLQNNAMKEPSYLT